MPVTARLSRRFYEKFGDDIVNELVELLNQVDLAYRSELREQNDMNFARFDAKLEQRLAELKLELRLDERFAELKGELRLDERFAELKRELRLDERFAQTQTQMAELKAEMIKWMFLFWAGTALAGLLLRR